MPSTPLPFDTTAFFERTAHYASAGRGQFTLNRLPYVLQAGNAAITDPAVQTRLRNRFSSFDIDKIFTAGSILKEGWAAKSITIPQMGLMTHPAYTFSGPTKSMAYLQNFGNLDVEFLMMGKTPDEARSLLYFFSRWQECIAGPRKQQFALSRTLDDGQGNQITERRQNVQTETDSEISTSDSIPFDVEYYDNYTTEAEIQVFSPSYVTDDATQQAIATNPLLPPAGQTPASVTVPQPIISAKLTELYPLTINPITTNWDNGDTILSLIVSFHFYYLKILR
jgi:hypothetical protein